MPETAEKLTMEQAFEKALSSEKNDEPEKDALDEPQGDTDGQKSEHQPEENDKAADQAEETAETEHLLSPEDREKLSDEGKETYKRMQKAYTQKTQGLAAERKSLAEERERYGRYADLISSLEQDEEGTLKKLSALYGTPQKQETKPDAIQEQVSKMESQLTNLLGEENKELAKGLSTVFEGNMKELASAIAKNELEPIKAQLQTFSNSTAAQQAQAYVKEFEKDHKDWKQHEAKMTEIMQTVQPAQNADPVKYLSAIYDLATKDQTAADTTQKVVERMKQSVESAETPDQGVKDNIVTPTAPKKPTMEEAFAAAKKGIKWE